MYGNKCIGRAAQKKQTLQFFHVRKKYFLYAPALLEKVIKENSIERVFVMTQDPLLCALIAEWEYEKEKHACFFTDSGRKEIPEATGIFRLAVSADTLRIRRFAGKFFDTQAVVFHRWKNGLPPE